MSKGLWSEHGHLDIVGGSYATCVDSPNDQSTTSGHCAFIKGNLEQGKSAWSQTNGP